MSAMNIIEGMIGSVIVGFFIWLGKKYGTKAVEFFSTINKKYSGKIYTEASKGQTNKILIIMFYLIVLFVVMFSSFICTFIWSTPTTIPTNPTVDTIIINSLGIIIVILNLFLLEFYSRQSVIYRYITDFNHKLKIIRPKIDDEINNWIQQQWALMQSKDDYNKIYDKIDKHLGEIENYKPDKEYFIRQKHRKIRNSHSE